MPKSLHQLLKKALRRKPKKYAVSLIRMLDGLIAKSRCRKELEENLKEFLAATMTALRKRGVSEDYLAQEMIVIGLAGIICSDFCQAWWLSILSPAILLLLFYLASTLDNNLVPERQDFTFEEIKQSLLDRHWPPQRQRCDFVAASAY